MHENDFIVAAKLYRIAATERLPHSLEQGHSGQTGPVKGCASASVWTLIMRLSVLHVAGDLTMPPTTPERVPAHTSEPVNWRIQQDVADSVRWHARHPQRIDTRLRELDEEWDIERTLEANAATLALTGTLLGICVDKRFLALPVVVSAFLLQHALQGWCPPVPFFRKRGVRTMREIDEERYALKALRGDFVAGAGKARD